MLSSSVSDKIETNQRKSFIMSDTPPSHVAGIKLRHELNVIGRYNVFGENKEMFSDNDWEIIQKYIKLTPEEQEKFISDLGDRGMSKG